VRRRDLILGLAGLAATAVRSSAQQKARRRLIAILDVGSLPFAGASLETFRQALRALGFGDDDIAIESRWADGHADRLPGLAAELVHLAPEVIVVPGSAARAAMQATATPIVMPVCDDPVGAGLVASLARPGGNVTGLSFAQEDTVGKELQLLKTLVPGAERIAVLVNPHNIAHGGSVRALKRSAGTLRTELVLVEAGGTDEIDRAFASLKRERADALLVLGDGLFTSERNRIIALAASHSLPAIYHDHIFVEGGGLISYGGDLGDNWRRAATFVDKILKGAKPADLPIEQPTRFYLYLNAKTAKALGLAVPPLLLAQADEVIE
jgi:putative tryptophan/tyrosine transport system substrate-binding protein